jgi:hypothetical protein
MGGQGEVRFGREVGYRLGGSSWTPMRVIGWRLRGLKWGGIEEGKVCFVLLVVGDADFCWLAPRKCGFGGRYSSLRSSLC